MWQRTVLESFQSNFLAAPGLVSAVTELNFSSETIIVPRHTVLQIMEEFVLV
ncbi:Protein prenylyltransferase superfamily protein [Zea mays]|uniref:Protein prenylyltransferase superfamily protein n=1 Tax=Zea mays TaxID=4577 RepID=A0A1D6LBT0_MAIZE|nr:Protein prenylyltransferase superfamily protein [Zea mays]